MSSMKEEIHHDNNSHCFENHKCTNCKHKKTPFGKTPCINCVGIHIKDKNCKWEREQICY